MTDQINPMGNQASGLSLPLLVASAPRPGLESTRPAKIADPPVQGPDASFLAGSGETPVAALQQLNGHLQQTGSELKFQLDQATGRTVFKVVNPKDGTVVIQVPSEEMLALARNVRSMEKEKSAAGILLDKNG
jgi:hypothetical protein